MDFFKGILGDPIDLIKKVITMVSKSQADDVFEDLFLHRMNADARVKLGKRLVKAGTDLQVGKVADASDELAEVVGSIKF